MRIVPRSIDSLWVSWPFLSLSIAPLLLFVRCAEPLSSQQSRLSSLVCTPPKVCRV